MANFNTHLFIASTASMGAALVASGIHLIANADMPWFIFLGTLGGILPDIDASNSRPAKLLFITLALMGVAVSLHMFKNEYEPYPLLAIIAGTYLSIRYLIFTLFNTFTIHRGVFHSILAALFFFFLTTCISHYFLHWPVLRAWLNGAFIAFGFVVHLLLDEIYSVDLSNARIKSSFGTALKLISYKNKRASVLMAICTLMLFLATPSTVSLLKTRETIHQNYHFVSSQATKRY